MFGRGQEGLGAAFTELLLLPRCGKPGTGSRCPGKKKSRGAALAALGGLQELLGDGIGHSRRCSCCWCQHGGWERGLLQPSRKGPRSCFPRLGGRELGL